MKHEDKKYFDVSKPRRHAPNPTSKPIIVGHHPMMPDPMIREKRQKSSKSIHIFSEPKESTTTDNYQPKTNKLPDLADISAPYETSPSLTPSASQPSDSVPTSADSSESAPATVVSPPESSLQSDKTRPTSSQMTPQTPLTQSPDKPLSSFSKEQFLPELSEPPAGQELHIPAGHVTSYHKPRIWVWVIVVLVILAWIYAAIDALTTTKLPIELFTKT
jgi:hypothetical protein